MTSQKKSTPTRIANTERGALDNFINSQSVQRAFEYATALAEHYLGGGIDLDEPDPKSAKGFEPYEVRDEVVRLVTAIEVAEGDNRRAVYNAFGRINRMFASMPYGGSCNFQYPHARMPRNGGDIDIVDELNKYAVNLEKLRVQLVATSESGERRDAELARFETMMSGAAGFFGEMVKRQQPAKPKLINGSLADDIIETVKRCEGETGEKITSLRQLARHVVETSADPNVLPDLIADAIKSYDDVFVGQAHQLARHIADTLDASTADLTSTTLGKFGM